MTTNRKYAKNSGLRKVCGCGRRKWPTCTHSYYLNYRGFRGSLDVEAGRHLDYQDALNLANQIRSEIDARTFVARRQRPGATVIARPDLPPPIDPGGLTVAQVGDRYFKQARNRLTGEPLQPRERANWDKFANFVVASRGDLVPIKDLKAAAVTAEHVRLFYEAQAELRSAKVTNGKSITGKQRATYTRQVGGPVSANRTGDRAATVFRWAAGHPSETGVAHSPFRDGAGDRVMPKYGELARERRLEPGEEDALLAAAAPHLRLCIIAALESTLRISELLALRWRQVDFEAGCMHLRGRSVRAREGTKTRKGRVIPLTARMRVVLEYLQIGPDGKPHHPTAYVFGDGTTGEKRKSLATAWDTCRLKAYGFTGRIREPRHAKLTPEARAALKEQDLRWHDLRRESASKHIDRGMRLNELQTMIGHANLATTSRYVKPRTGWVQEAAHRVDAHPQSANELQKIANELEALKRARFGEASKSVN
jgi:integrase